MAIKREIDKENMFRKIMPSAGMPKAAEPAATPPAPPPEKAAGGILSPEAIAALFAQAEKDKPETQTAQAKAPQDPPANVSGAADAKDTAPPAPAHVKTPAYAEAPPQAGVPAHTETPPHTETPAHVSRPAATPPNAHGPEQPYPVNLAELLITEYYPRYSQRLSACQCARCRDDACGMALNRIKPRYVPSDRLHEADLSDRTLITETVTALIQSIFKVKRSPHHDEIDLMRH